MNISAHITYEEATKSQTAIRHGIENVPTSAQLERMKVVAEKCFEPVRKRFGPLKVSSFFRCKELNDAVGGSKTSQHKRGEAIDIDGDPFGEFNSTIFYWIKDNLDFDQLIWEYGNETNPAWVHVSYKSVESNRKKITYIK